VGIINPLDRGTLSVLRTKRKGDDYPCSEHRHASQASQGGGVQSTARGSPRTSRTDRQKRSCGESVSEEIRRASPQLDRTETSDPSRPQEIRRIQWTKQTRLRSSFLWFRWLPVVSCASILLGLHHLAMVMLVASSTIRATIRLLSSSVLCFCWLPFVFRVVPLFYRNTIISL
jgi:hypothetical protein